MSANDNGDLNLPLVERNDEPAQSHSSPKRWLASVSFLLLGCAGVFLFAYNYKTNNFDIKSELGNQFTEVKQIGGTAAYLKVGSAVGVSDDGKFVVATSPDYNNYQGYIGLFDGKTGDLLDEVYGPGGTGAHFGQSVAIDSDGKYVAVGAYKAQGQKGAVYVYSIHNDKLVPINPSVLIGDNTYDEFGYSVFIVRFAPQGQQGEQKIRLAVGARASGSNRLPYVKIFEAIDGSGFYQITDPPITNNDLKSNFGAAVSLAENGDLLIVGVPNRNKAMVYKESAPDSGQWFQNGELPFSNVAKSAYCGTSVSVDKGGTRAVVGCASYNQVNLWTRDPSGNQWTPGSPIRGSPSGFGYSLSFSAGGQYLVIGSPNYGSYAGQAAYYKLNGATYRFAASTPQASYGAYAGSAVSVSPGGVYSVCGCPYNNFNGKKYAGSIFIYKCEGSICD